MKKLLAIWLILALLLVPGMALGAEVTVETDQEKLAGDWFAQVRGMDLVLTLTVEGTYALQIGTEITQGTWTLTDGAVYLDGSETPSLYPVGEKLAWWAMGLFLTREQSVGAYVPAELLGEEVPADAFNGYWTCLFVDVGGTILPACELNEVTDVYVQAPRAALGGPLFGDVGVDMTFENGTMIFVESDVSVTLALQTDGLMRMTLVAPDTALILYLMPTYAQGASPVPEA